MKEKVGIYGVLLSALLMTTSAAGAQTPAPPVVTNGSFEDGGDLPSGWQFNNEENGTGILEVRSGNARSGERSIVMHKTSSAGYSIMVSDFIPVVPGQRYQARLFARTKRLSRASVYLMVSQYSADSPDMRFPNEFGRVKPFYPSGDEWLPIDTIFEAREGNTRAKVHIIVTGAPADVEFDDLELLPAVGGHKWRFEPPTAETLAPLEATMEHLKRRQRAVATRRMVGKRPRLFADGKPLEPAFYVAPFWNPESSQINDFQRAGEKLYFVPLVLGRGVYGDRGPWSGKGQVDFKEIDDLLWRVLRADPDAYIMFYMATDPYPRWGEDHPDDVTTDQNGKKAVVDMHIKDWGREPKYGTGATERYGPSLYSTALREETSEVLRGLVRHIKNSLPGKAVIGYHVAGGNDGQFFQSIDYSAANPHLTDYSPAAQTAFRDWLRRRYRTEATLRRAWNRNDVTFDSAIVPTGERRLKSGFFLDTKTEQDIADYNRFYNDGIMETIQTFARVLKKESGNNILISTYHAGAGANVDSHISTGQLLSTPDIDFTVSVADYDSRLPGDTGKSHAIWGSLLLHGRIGLTEQDLRSWKTGPPPSPDQAYGRVDTAEEHNALVRRESGMMLAFGNGSWWYDMSGGWFNDPGIMRGIKEVIEAHKRDAANPETPRADLAVFVDERSLDYLGAPSHAAYHYTAIARQIFALNRSGVPYHLYLQSDLPNPALHNYKAYLFLNANHFSSDEMTALKKLKRDGKAFCFVHAPNVIGATDPAAGIASVTGIHVKKLPTDILIHTNGLPASLVAKAPFPTGDVVSEGQINGPAFAVDDVKALPLGCYNDGQIAIAARDFGTWKSAFFGGLTLSDTFINGLARWAGAWVAADAGDAVYANQHFLTAHALWASDKKLTLAQPSKVIDLSDGKTIAARATSLTLSLKRGETRWFHLEPVK